MTNTELVERYPFLALKNVWTGIIIEGYDPEIDGTYLDNMPDGWRIAFGEQMCEEIREALLKANYLDKYFITQIKEKYGSLRWYDTGATEEVYKIIAKYEELSKRTCCVCGKPATKITRDWICPYCDDCYEKYESNQKYWDIDYYYPEN